MKKIIQPLFYLFLPIILGSIVGFLISGSIDYSSINKPFLTPPKIFFPIAWSIIYLLMGLSYFLFRKEYPNNTKISIVYYLQFFVNLLWSIIFFVWKWRFFSILWILLLDLLVIYLMYLFFYKKKISCYLNLLYLLWILFATYLTIGIYILN